MLQIFQVYFLYLMYQTEDEFKDKLQSLRKQKDVRIKPVFNHLKDWHKNHRKSLFDEGRLVLKAEREEESELKIKRVEKCLADLKISMAETLKAINGDEAL